MRTAVLDRVEGPGAVDHADLQVLPLDQPYLAWLEVLDGADFDDLRHATNPSAAIGFGQGASRRPLRARRRPRPRLLRAARLPPPPRASIGAPGRRAGWRPARAGSPRR